MKRDKKTKRELAAERVERELRLQVKLLLESGELALPLEADLAKQYGVSRNTMRIALKILKNEGLIQSIPGKGNFVVPKDERSKLTLVLCYEDDFVQNPFTSMVVNTVLSIVREQDRPAIMGVMRANDDDWNHLGVDGLDVGAVFVFGGTQEYWSAIQKKSGVPFVMLTDFFESIRHRPFCLQVFSNGRAAGFLATQTMLKRGHKRIMLVLWSSDMVWTRNSVSGYKDALELAGIEFDEKLILYLPSNNVDFESGHYVDVVESVKSQADELFDGEHPPTSLIYNGSSEQQMLEVSKLYFHNRFKNDSTVALGYEESLIRDFNGSGEAWAVGMKFGSLVKYALLVLSSYSDCKIHPARYLVDEYVLYHRKHSEWKVVE